MGPDSDLKTLIPGLKLLKYYFSIELDVPPPTAHPPTLAGYASNAASRGIEVIIGPGALRICLAWWPHTPHSRNQITSEGEHVRRNR